jgi:hypothetical protein
MYGNFDIVECLIRNGDKIDIQSEVSISIIF